MQTNDQKGPRPWVERFATKVASKAHFLKEKIEVNMIGPIEKGMEAAKLQTPPKGEYKGVNLKILPKYISYRSALLKEKVNLQFFCLGIIALFSVHYLSTRLEVTKLYKKLREKEYILAPGVLDFTTASPQNIPDRYINDAVNSFAMDLGNINPTNIEEQYKGLEIYMSDKVRVQFQLEYEDWIDQVKKEEISQIFTITDKEIISDDNGSYKATIFGRAEFYSNSQFLGHEDQVVEMILSLVPPKSGKRWYLQIDSLSWSKADSFQQKTK